LVLDTREREQSDAAYWWLRGTSQGANLQWAPGHDDACLDWPIYEEDHPVDEADQRLRSIERLVGKLQGQESLVLATDLFREIVDRIASKVGALHEYRDLARSMQGALGVEPQALSRMIGTGDDIDAFLAGTATLSEAGKRKLKEANDSLTLAAIPHSTGYWRGESPRSLTSMTGPSRFRNFARGNCPQPSTGLQDRASIVQRSARRLL